MFEDKASRISSSNPILNDRRLVFSASRVDQELHSNETFGAAKSSLQEARKVFIWIILKGHVDGFLQGGAPQLAKLVYNSNI